MLQWTREYRHLFQLVLPFSSDKDPEVDHMAIFNFLRNLHTVLYSNLAREIPWTEEPGRLQSTGSQKIGHYWSNLACKCTPIYVPTDSAQGFPFFYILTSIISHPFDNRHSFLKYNFICFWLCWVFIAARVFPQLKRTGGTLQLRWIGFSLWWLLLLRRWALGHEAFSSCDTWAQ